MSISKSGAEFPVNTTTPGRQLQPQAAALQGGGFVVVWTDESNGPGDVRGQIFSATGTKLGAEFVVNTSLVGGQSQARVAALDPVFDEREHFVTATADGGFILGARVNDGEAAVDGFQDREFLTQKYSGAGVQVSGRTQLTENAGAEIDLRAPVAAAREGGGSVVMFIQKPFGGPGDLRVLVLDDNGASDAGATIVAGSVEEILTPLAIDAAPGGGFIALYSRTPAPGAAFFDTFAFQRSGPGGAPIGGEVVVGTVRNTAVETRETLSASITVLPDGRFVIVAESGGSTDTAQPVRPVARLYSSDGVQIGEPVVVSAVGGPGFFFKNAPTAVTLADGRVAIAFVDGDLINATDDTSNLAIRAVIFAVEGAGGGGGGGGGGGRSARAGPGRTYSSARRSPTRFPAAAGPTRSRAAAGRIALSEGRGTTRSRAGPGTTRSSAAAGATRSTAAAERTASTAAAEQTC